MLLCYALLLLERAGRQAGNLGLDLGERGGKRARVVVFPLGIRFGNE